MSPAPIQDDRILNWGILGSGAIARTFAGAIARTSVASLHAVASRNPLLVECPEDFHGARLVTYADLLDDPNIDIVYIALPHSEHAPWAVKALMAHKHVVCEKPLAINAYDAMAVVDAARTAGRFLMEAFMYRLHPQIEVLHQLVSSGEIGTVKDIRASFGFCTDFDAKGRLFNNALGGGGILDVGCYAMSFARLVAGAAQRRPFADALSVEGEAVLGVSGVDERASATVTFAGGLKAYLECAITHEPDNTARVTGDRGSITLTSPWLPDAWDYPAARIVVTNADGCERVIEFPANIDLYALEVERATRAILDGNLEPAFPASSWADSIGNMRGLDAWRQAIGLTFAAEAAPNRKIRFSGKPLQLQHPLRIPQTDRLKVGKRASAIALGGADVQVISHADHLYDAFFEAGGTIFDTAWIYEESDTALGHWMANRGVRDEVIVIGKGAHSPDCFPDRVAPELDQSLTKLQTSFVDVYMLHRDNPEVPVGEFVDVLDREHRAGRFTLYGVSNWSRERFDEAVAYARREGKAAPGVLSNNFSLAEMAEPVWEGCIAASDGDWKDWLRMHQIPLLAWSSQARGFFADRVAGDPLADPNFARSWETPVNLARRERARVLAERMGARTTHVALAYVLRQQLPVVPIIGPLTLDELNDSLKALSIPLSDADVSWLEG